MVIKCEKLKNELLGREVKSNKGFAGIIVGFSEEACFIQNRADLTAVITLNNNQGEKRVALFTALEKGSISFDNYQISEEALIEFNVEAAILVEEKLKKEEANCLERQRKKEAERARVEKQKFEKKLKKTEADLDNKLKVKAISVNSDWPFALGYLAKYGGTVQAVMPDSLENWFIRNFGDVKRRVVDSKKRTSGGHSMQWALGLSIPISSKAPAAPSKLSSLISKQNKIENVSFIYELIDKHGFEIGEKPNYDKVIATISDEYRDSFIAGYNM